MLTAHKHTPKECYFDFFIVVILCEVLHMHIHIFIIDDDHVCYTQTVAHVAHNMLLVLALDWTASTWDKKWDAQAFKCVWCMFSLRVYLLNVYISIASVRSDDLNKTQNHDDIYT